MGSIYRNVIVLVKIWHYETLYTLSLKETICSAQGLDCYSNIKTASNSCLSDCQGLQADLREEDVDQISLSDEMLSTYEHFKNGFQRNILYPESFESQYNPK